MFVPNAKSGNPTTEVTLLAGDKAKFESGGMTLGPTHLTSVARAMGLHEYQCVWEEVSRLPPWLRRDSVEQEWEAAVDFSIHPHPTLLLSHCWWTRLKGAGDATLPEEQMPGSDAKCRRNRKIRTEKQEQSWYEILQTRSTTPSFLK